MCGLVGMAGNLFNKHKNMFKDMIYFDTLRGQDSTGVACQRSNRDILTYKLAVPGYEFIEMHGFRDTVGMNDRFWMAHNRFKTVGGASRRNAHPFEVINDKGEVLLVGAHNGTIDNRADIPDAKLYETDSEGLLNDINDRGPKEAIGNVRGAWSLAWYDAVTDQLFFLRNAQRPMCYAFSEDREVFFWASEAWMIRIAAERNDVKFFENKIYMTTVDRLYALDFPHKGKKFEDLKSEGGYEGKAPLAQANFQGGWKQHGKGGWYDNRGKEGTLKEIPPLTRSGTTQTNTGTGPSDEKEGELKPGQTRGFQGVPVDNEFVKLLRGYGCVWCGDVVPQPAPLAWVDHDAIVCFNCLRDEHGKKDNVIELKPEQREILRQSAADRLKEAGMRLKSEHQATAARNAAANQAALDKAKQKDQQDENKKKMANAVKGSVKKALG